MKKEEPKKKSLPEEAPLGSKAWIDEVAPTKEQEKSGLDPRRILVLLEALAAALSTHNHSWRFELQQEFNEVKRLLEG